MATIGNVRLRITEQQGRADALVTYTVTGSEEDIEEQLRYVEIVELIGVDASPGEDGTDDSIPGGRTVDLLRFPLAVSQRRHPFDLPSSALDEDRRLGPDVAFPFEDEIRARVTLRPILNATFGDSNIVKRGAPVSEPTLAVPA